MSRRPPQPFEHLLPPLRAAGLLVEAAGHLEAPVASLSHDSRAVEPQACFFALVGDGVDGHLFLDKAVQHGATTAVCERPLEEAPAGLRAVARVTDARAALAEAAAVFFGRPSRALRLIGVTGTNGKTTVSHLLYHALGALGVCAGLIGTIEVRVGPRVRPATLTTPDALALNAWLAEMADEGCEACAMEVSSHALAQQRVRALEFAAAVFTNLTHEHLDYHGSFEAYAAAKAKLFRELPPGAVAVVNRDDPAWETMMRASRARLVTYGRADREPPARSLRDVAFSVEHNSISGLRLRLDGATRAFRLGGAFNAANLAAAYATLRELGYGQAETLDALAAAPPVPGRLQALRPADAGVEAPGPIAVIDYAHTPDALENVLRTVREMLPPGGAVHLVFGCGGDRDRAKRPAMGRIAAQLADSVTLTNDNPRTEDPQAILAEIIAGMPRPPDRVEPDRAAAIGAAIAAAAEDDIVVVAGKGHETYQVVGAARRHFDDREEALAALRRRAGAAGSR